MNRKQIGGFSVKDEAKGLVEAVFSTFNVVDKDGDVTLPGAFDEGVEVPISAYGHASWEGALPVGMATIHSTATDARLTGQFFMDTQHGRDTFLTVQHLGPKGQWSYGYDAKEYSYGEFDGRQVRFLAKQLVLEVSPVLVGAGVNTRTISAKSGRPEEGVLVAVKGAIRPHESDVVNELWDGAAALAGLPAGVTVTDLRAVAAWADPTQDPEGKSAYRFVHHTKAGGPANVRACLAGISALNIGMGDLGDEDRKAVYDHLAAHLRDADREPPELRTKGASIPFDLRDEIAGVLVGASALLESTDRVVALRAAKGKQLSKTNLEYLDWLDESLMAVHRKLRSYMDSPDDEGVREYLRFVKSQAYGGHHAVSGAEGGAGQARG